jgi:hypothetical protein
MVLDVTGSRLDRSFFDINKDKKVNGDDTTATPGGVPASGLETTVGIVGTATPQASGATDTLYASGSTGDVQGEAVDPGGGAVGRQAWRQITQ